MSNRSHIIVGDGITALAFLETCFSQGFRDVTIIGKRASQLGRGIAYAKGEVGTPWRYAYLLNSPADDIDPAFAVWLADHWTTVEATMSERKPDWLAAAAPLVEVGDIYGVNAPREIYGDYMEQLAQRAVADLAKDGTTVHFVDDIATGLSMSEDEVFVRTQKGQMITGGSADIAPGGPETMRFDGDDGPFSAPSVFGYEHRISEHIKKGAEIFCIGGNAAMLDVMRLCQSHLSDDNLKFVFCAPEGEVPPPLVPRLPRKLTKPQLTKGHETAESLLVEIGREIEKAEAGGDERREIRAGFRAHFLETPLQNYVADSVEAAQVSKALRFWLRGGTRDTIFDMQRLVRDGKVRVIKGRVMGIETTASGAIVDVDEGNGETRRHPTGYVVNCAGAGPNSRFDPLTEDMIAQNLIRKLPGNSLATGSGSRAGSSALRYLSPAVTQIGPETVAMPLYDAHMLRTYVARSAQLSALPNTG